MKTLMRAIGVAVGLVIALGILAIIVGTITWLVLLIWGAIL